jgi:hypothetical protein
MKEKTNQFIQLRIKDNINNSISILGVHFLESEHLMQNLHSRKQTNPLAKRMQENQTNDQIRAYLMLIDHFFVNCDHKRARILRFRCTFRLLRDWEGFAKKCHFLEKIEIYTLYMRSVRVLLSELIESVPLCRKRM